jgi:hypothetical protein
MSDPFASGSLERPYWSEAVPPLALALAPAPSPLPDFADAVIIDAGLLSAMPRGILVNQ